MAETSNQERPSQELKFTSPSIPKVPRRLSPSLMDIKLPCHLFPKFTVVTPLPGTVTGSKLAKEGLEVNAIMRFVESWLTKVTV